MDGVVERARFFAVDVESVEVEDAVVVESDQVGAEAAEVVGPFIVESEELPVVPDGHVVRVRVEERADDVVALVESVGAFEGQVVAHDVGGGVADYEVVEHLFFELVGIEYGAVVGVDVSLLERGLIGVVGLIKDYESVNKCDGQEHSRYHASSQRGFAGCSQSLDIHRNRG